MMMNKIEINTQLLQNKSKSLNVMKMKVIKVNGVQVV